MNRFTYNFILHNLYFLILISLSFSSIFNYSPLNIILIYNLQIFIFFLCLFLTRNNTYNNILLTLSLLNKMSFIVIIVIINQVFLYLLAIYTIYFLWYDLKNRAILVDNKKNVSQN